ncbi:MAG: DNA replication/repair protein RecF [Acetobacteraceae bacterium]|nr:DNA replication/repair protein RecF [Acetobacteraceae bacterium]
MPAFRLRRLVLTGFRSWASLSLDLPARITVIAGPNGAGKTNLLEAISLLAPGRGLRGAKPADLGRIGPEGQSAWAISADIEGPEGEARIATGTPPGGDPSARRVVLLDGVALRAQSELARFMAAAWLTPQMDRLFEDSASDRRRFLDRLVYALEPSHAREVAAHDAAMAGRNRLLAEGCGDPAWLAALEDSMARHAVAVVAARRALVARLNAALEAGVVGGFPAARLVLDCPIAAALEEGPALAAEEALRDSLAADRVRDAASGGAARGAHRTDFRMIHAESRLPADLCSTGERKALLVSTLLAHAALVGAARGAAPVLLLDEVAVHLDAGRRAALFAALAALPSQAILTGTDLEPFAPLRDVAAAFLAGGGGLAAAPGFAPADALASD